MKFQDRTTHQLKTGDVVFCHGSLFRLLDRNVSDNVNHDPTHPGGAVVWFRTEYVGPAHDRAIEAIPTAWRADWTVQGNSLATWAVLS